MGDMSTLAKIRRELGDLSPAIVAYICLVAFACVATFGTLLAYGTRVGSWSGVLGLSAIAALGERGRIKLRGSLDVSIAMLPAVFAAVLFGPVAAMIVFGASVLGLEIPFAGRLAYFCSRALTGAAAAGAAAEAAK